MSKTNEDNFFMKRCLELAELGIRRVAPNPMVGAVLVHNNKIIGEGYHESCGADHAEVAAIENVKDKALIKDSTLYVNLEPCNHHGRTPPCAERILTEKIKKVVVGTKDPNANIKGGGLELLKSNGVDIKVGVLNDECLELNKRFFTFHLKKRPFVILKWAQTSDGYIAKDDNERRWISSESSRELVHKWRSEEQAILIGRTTAMNDNPLLTSRIPDNRNPVRVVFDRKLRLEKTLNIFNSEAKTVIVNDSKDADEGNVLYRKVSYSAGLIPAVLELLASLQITSVLVEGGAMTLYSFISSNLWDEARVFYAPQAYESGLQAPPIKGKVSEDKMIKEDRLIIYRS